MIIDHRYDAGWPRDDSQGCIADDAKGLTCRAEEGRHAFSEYPSQRPAREDDYWIPFVSDGEHGTRFPDAGSMHEPKPYTGDLDWSDLAHPFVD